MKEPKVIDPADYNMQKAAKKCGMHMGVLGCPICDQNFCDYGGMRVIECTECQFQFPTDWWPVYENGVQDGQRVAAAGAELSGGMSRRMGNPYYQTGFITTEGEAWLTRKAHDWRAITAGWTPAICEEDAEMEAHMAKFMLVGPLVRRIKQEHKGKSWAGIEECPVCKGKLHLSHAAYNGHVHGKCETEDCLSWME